MGNKFGHFLYPLSQTSGYGFEHNGKVLPTGRANFFIQMDYRKSDEWVVSKNASKLQINDFLWAHFALPDSAICAVGRVVKTACWKQEWGAFAIKIRWDKSLTEILKESPILFSAHRQVPRGAVTEANDHTATVLTRWLSGKVSKSSKIHDEEVRFRTAQVDQRLGQPQFRLELIRAYNNTCAVTGCTVDQVLEAAHIRPVKNEGSHSCANGLLLRADIHNLFDSGLLTIDKNYFIYLDKSLLESSEYKKLHRRKLKMIPKQIADRPRKATLEEHRKLFLAL